MQPPRRIHIGPHTYTLDISEQRCDDAQVRFGQTNHATTEIIVHPRQAASQMRDTVLHEALHAVCEMQGVEHGGTKALFQDEDEERFIRAFTPLPLDTLRRNPQLVTFLTER